MSSRLGSVCTSLLGPNCRISRLGFLGSVALAAVALLAGCFPQNAARVAAPASNSVFSTVTGSGNLVTRQVDMQDFTEVEVGSAFKVDITRSDNFGVTVTADDNLIDIVDVAKSGQTLRVGLRSGSYNNATYRASVRMPDLRRLQITGASTVTFSGFMSRGLDLGLSGASQVTGRLEGGQLNLAALEASTATLGGSADGVALTASGASQASLGDLPARTRSGQPQGGQHRHCERRRQAGRGPPKRFEPLLPSATHLSATSRPWRALLCDTDRKSRSRIARP